VYDLSDVCRFWYWWEWRFLYPSGAPSQMADYYSRLWFYLYEGD